MYAKASDMTLALTPSLKLRAQRSLGTAATDSDPASRHCAPAAEASLLPAALGEPGAESRHAALTSGAALLARR
jgi:hypothetical protein